MSVPLHEHFAGVECTPGESHVTGPVEEFALVNVLEFGGAPDRPTHVPAELARIGPMAVWESTGSSEALPFWNTNFDADAWLYLVHGSVRIEFKQPETDVRYGHQDCRTGDLFKLPRGIAHRTLSGDGRRRISLEFLLESPSLGTSAPPAPVEPDPSGVLGGFTFEPGPDAVTVRTPAGELREDPHFFFRAMRALVAHGLHLGHNELLGGTVIHDHGDTVTLRAAGHEETFPNARALAVLSGLRPG